MSFLPLRSVPLPRDAEARCEAWVDAVERALDDPSTDRNQLCRTILTEIYYPELADRDPTDLSPTTRLLLDQLDPRLVTLEPEYYRDIDVERYRAVKPLQWLWEMFDRSPLGKNVHLGVRFRRVLARKIFRHCGRNFKAFHQVKFSFGYNLDVSDDVVVHRHVLLDDRGGIQIGDGASVSDYANVYSHTHDIVDGREVLTLPTVIEAGVRITYHATILAGTRVSRDSMVGAGAILTRDTQPHWVYVGVPARPAKEKPAAERSRRKPPTADPLATVPTPGA